MQKCAIFNEDGKKKKEVGGRGGLCINERILLCFSSLLHCAPSKWKDCYYSAAGHCEICLFGIICSVLAFRLRAKGQVGNLCVFANSRVRTTSVPLNVSSLFLDFLSRTLGHMRRATCISSVSYVMDVESFLVYFWMLAFRKVSTCLDEDWT